MRPLLIPLWWITYNVNKLTHITYLVMYFVTIIKQKFRFVDFRMLTNLLTKVAPRCTYFWNKWSWGLYVIPLWQITYNVNKLTHITYLVMYLVTIIKKQLKCVDFCLLTRLCAKVAPRRPDFWNKWSWGLYVILIWRITYNVNKSTHTTYLVMYLVTIIKQKFRFAIFACFPVYAPKLHPDAHTFEINGHEASMWYHYDK